ncbi:hypothetical protein [Vibrio sp.]
MDHATINRWASNLHRFWNIKPESKRSGYLVCGAWMMLKRGQVEVVGETG